MNQKRMQTWCCEVVLFLSVLVYLAHPLAAVADYNLTVYPNIRNAWHYVSQTLNRCYFENEAILCAYDLESGKQCWTRFLWVPGVQLSSVFGKRHLALYSGTEGLVVLDAVTGQETWRCLESRDGAVISVAFSDRNDLLGVLQERAWRVYSSEGEFLYRQSVAGPLSRVDSIPDTDAFYLQKFKSIKQSPTDTEVYVWRPDAGSLMKAFDLQTPGIMAIIAALPGETFLVIERGVEAKTGMHKILNVKGETTHAAEVKVPGTYLGYANGGKTIILSAQPWQEAVLVDWATGETVATLKCDGHLFEGPYRGNMGGLISRDGDNNVYFWSFTMGNKPHKILDGRNFLPGNIRSLTASYIDCAWGREKRYFWERRLLDGLEPVGKISFPYAGEREKRIYSSDIPFRVVQTCEKGSGNNGDGRDWYYTGTACVYEAGREAPLLKAEGHVHEISPDGRFIIMQSEPNEGRLVEVESGNTLATFAGKSEYTYVDACFSHDSRRIAVQHYPFTSITLLESPYPSVSVKYGNGYGTPNCFSPDGTKLLSGGSGCAYIHNTATGEQQQQFMETARFKEPYQNRQDSFLNLVAGVAEDFAGNFTDRFKNRPWVEAVFSRNGEEVITIAVNNLLRVWNASSGKELRHIEFNLPEQRDANGSINNCVTLSPNGDYAIALNRNGFADISLWSIRTGRVIRRFTHSGPQCYHNAVSDDGRKIYLGRADMLCVYDFGTDEKDNR